MFHIFCPLLEAMNKLQDQCHIFYSRFFIEKTIYINTIIVRMFEFFDHFSITRPNSAT